MQRNCWAMSLQGLQGMKVQLRSPEKPTTILENDINVKMASKAQLF